MLVLVALGLPACGVSDSAVVAEPTADEPATGTIPNESRRDIVATPTEGIVPTATVESTVVPDTTSTATVSTPTITNDTSAMQSVDVDDTTTQPDSPTPTFDENSERALLLHGNGLIELLLTDTQGRRLGYDPTTGNILEEIPNSVYYRDTSIDVSYLFLVAPAPDDYIITVTGIEAGDYEIYGWYADETARAGLLYEKGALATDQSETIPFDLPVAPADVPNPPDVQVGRDMTSVVNQPVTFNGTFSDINPDDTHTLTWDFGDGNGASDTLTPTHTYTMSGVYTTTLTVDDNTGFVISDTLQVDVTAPGR